MATTRQRYRERTGLVDNARGNVWNTGGGGSLLDGFGHNERTGLGRHLHVNMEMLSQNGGSGSQHGSQPIGTGRTQGAMSDSAVASMATPSASTDAARARERALLSQLADLRQEHKSLEHQMMGRTSPTNSAPVSSVAVSNTYGSGVSPLRGGPSGGGQFDPDMFGNNSVQPTPGGRGGNAGGARGGARGGGGAPSFLPPQKRGPLVQRKPTPPATPNDFNGIRKVQGPKKALPQQQKKVAMGGTQQILYDSDRDAIEELMMTDDFEHRFNHPHGTPSPSGHTPTTGGGGYQQPAYPVSPQRAFPAPQSHLPAAICVHCHRELQPSEVAQYINMPFDPSGPGPRRMARK